MWDSNEFMIRVSSMALPTWIQMQHSCSMAMVHHDPQFSSVFSIHLYPGTDAVKSQLPLPIDYRCGCIQGSGCPLIPTQSKTPPFACVCGRDKTTECIKLPTCLHQKCVHRRALGYKYDLFWRKGTNGWVAHIYGYIEWALHISFTLIIDMSPSELMPHQIWTCVEHAVRRGWTSEFLQWGTVVLRFWQQLRLRGAPFWQAEDATCYLTECSKPLLCVHYIVHDFKRLWNPHCRLALSIQIIVWKETDYSFSIVRKKINTCMVRCVGRSVLTWA